MRENLQDITDKEFKECLESTINNVLNSSKSHPLFFFGEVSILSDVLGVASYNDMDQYGNLKENSYCDLWTDEMFEYIKNNKIDKFSEMIVNRLLEMKKYEVLDYLIKKKLL